MRFLPGVLFVAGTAGLCRTPPAANHPAKMIKIVVRLTGSEIKPGSIATLPKTVYVADPHYARIEDPPDARQGIHKLTIIAEPDAYSINLIDKKGTHAIDQGGPNDLHLPVVLPFDTKHQMGKVDRLEFGDEFDFFEDAGATRQAGPIVNAKPTDAYVLKTPNTEARLVVRAGTHIPITLSWSLGGRNYTYEYITYEDVPFDPSLFSRPKGITFKEIIPDTVAEPG
jgi:hypothetical protein